MTQERKSYSQAAQQLGFVLKKEGLSAEEIRTAKTSVQEIYNSWVHMVYDRAYLNWGLWDKKINQKYQNLHFFVNGRS